jgi:hypothetical protein
MSEVKANKISPATSTVVTLGDSSDTFVVTTGAKIDINGTELILDADADTSITADTDDQIDIRIAGADDFQFTANTFTAAASSVVALDDGAVATPALTNTGDLNTGIYFPAADTVGVTAGGTEQFRFGSNPIPGGSKNSFINGNMLIDQRGSTASMGSANGATYGGPDRFCVHVQSSPQGRGTVTQDATVLAGSGQSKSYKFDCTTAESAVAAGEEIAIQYRFEGQDIQHWMYGQTNAVTLTLSFDFRSPKSGTHCVAFYAMDDNEYYVAEFTVASADTFEHFEITVALKTSGTDIVADSSEGMRITWPLVCGSSFQGSAGAWANGEIYATSNQQNLLDNTANNIYLSGVQLEVGSVATDFAHEDYGTTRQKAYRYYQRWNITTAYGYIASGHNAGTTVSRYILPTRQTMRAAPTLEVSAVADFQVQDATGSKDTTNVTLMTSFPEVVTIAATPASSQTVSLATMFGADNSTSRWFALSSEL